MARVEIENRAWSDPRLKVFKTKAKITTAHAIGILATIWHDSQESGKTECTEDDVQAWLADERKFKKHACSMLVASGYMTKIDPETDPNEVEKSSVECKTRYKICGNTSKIEIVSRFKTRSSIAANRRWQKTKKTREETEIARENTLSDDESPDACSIDKHCLSTDTKHDSSNAHMHICTYAHSYKKSFLRKDHATDVAVPSKIDFVSESDDDEKPDRQNREAAIVSLPSSQTTPARPAAQKRKPTTGGREKAASDERVKGLIAAYCDAFKRKFGHHPEIVGAEAGAAKRLVKDLGLEKSVRYVEAYLTMNDSWFVRQDFKLSILASNVNKVKTFIETGVTTTQTVAAQTELSSHNEMVARQYLNRRRAQEQATAELEHGDSEQTIDAPF